jgi:polyisoprenyl-phosphate glycosyltransferase
MYLFLDKNYSNYEIVMIDQGNINLSVKQKQGILLSVPSIRWLTLSDNVEDEVAFNAGVENTIGDYIVLLRLNIDPIEIVKNMVSECSQGFDMVTGVALSESTIGYRIFRKVSDKILKWIEYDIPKNSSPVRCMSRTAINIILQTSEPGHQLYIKASKAYPQSKVYEYVTLKDSQIHKRNLYDGIKKTLHLMVFNSTKPLRWASMMGVLGSLIALIFSFYSIVVNILKDNVQEGWTSTVLFSSIQFTILFIMLGFIGEYLSRLLNQSHNQKGYYIVLEENSSVMLAEDRLNIQHIKE